MKAKIIKTGEIVEVYHETQHGQQSIIYKECVFVNGRMWSEEELDFAYTKEANEAPEKIYVCDNVFPNHVDWEGSPINTKRIDNHDIEYIRTDSFLKKACAWLKENGGSYWMDDYDLPTDELVDDFKKYMKGE